MNKTKDQDIEVIRKCVAALEQSSSPDMIQTNLRYLIERYNIFNPVVTAIKYPDPDIDAKNPLDIDPEIGL